MKLTKRILLIIVSIILILLTTLYLYYNLYTPKLSDRHGIIDSKLYTGNSTNQPLIVTFGGSDGGNNWTDEGYWSETRNKFIKKGYAILSMGYFKTENTPHMLDRISLNAIYDTIISKSNHPKINKSKIALLGGSRGGELVLNLASRYKDFNAVVALVPSHVTFPGITSNFNTSAWTHSDTEVDFMTIPYYKLIWNSIQGKYGLTQKDIEESEKYFNNSIISVENINGPILLVSAKNDKVWPSEYMSKKVMTRLKENQFNYHYEHFSFDGDHHETIKHFDIVFKFLDEHFK